MRRRGLLSAIVVVVALSALPTAASAGSGAADHPSLEPLWREFPLDPRREEQRPLAPPPPPVTEVPPLPVPLPLPEPVPPPAAPQEPEPVAAVAPLADEGGLGTPLVVAASVLAALLIGLAATGPYVSRSAWWRRRVPGLRDEAVAWNVGFALMVGAGGLGVLVVLLILTSI